MWNRGAEDQAIDPAINTRLSTSALPAEPQPPCNIKVVGYVTISLPCYRLVDDVVVLEDQQKTEENREQLHKNSAIMSQYHLFLRELCDVKVQYPHSRLIILKHCKPWLNGQVMKRDFVGNQRDSKRPWPQISDESADWVTSLQLSRTNTVPTGCGISLMLQWGGFALLGGLQSRAVQSSRLNLLLLISKPLVLDQNTMNAWITEQ